MASDADYRAWVEVLPDFQEFNAAVQAVVVGGLGQSGTAGSAAMGGTLLAGVKKLALPLTALIGSLGIVNALDNAIRAGIDAGVSYATESVQQGSDFNESLNAIAVAYGDFADDLAKISESSATELGLSQLDFNQIATQFSAFAKTIQRDNPVGFIDDLSHRGADFASVYNVEVSEALRLFQSGLAGETEPLRKFGIDLSAATVAGYAYANGIAEQGTQLNETQRQQAAYLALMDQTSITQGDFANTSDQLANRQRILNAQWEDAQAQLGMQLLPILQELLTVVSEDLMPVWIEFNEALGPQLRNALEAALPTFRELVDNVLPLIIRSLPLVVGGFVYLINVLESAAAHLNLVAVAADGLLKLITGQISFEEFADNIGDAVARIAELPSGFDEVRIATLQAAADIGSGMQEVGDAADSAGQQIVRGIGDGAEEARTVARRLPGEVAGALRDTKQTAGARLAGQKITQSFADGIRSAIGSAGAAVQDVLDFVASFFPHSPAERGPFSGPGWAAVGEAGAAIMRQFESGLTPVEVPLSVSAGLSSSIPTTPGVLRIESDVSAANGQLDALERRAARGLRIPVEVSIRAGRRVP